MADGPKGGAKDLASKVYDWLATEGYPLEFEAANIMRASGFRTRQGLYVRNSEGGNAREIDVVGTVESSDDDQLWRIYQVVECKWSRDRPWVVFTSTSRMATSACATQTIASTYGSALMWAMAGNPRIRNMQLFTSPERPGFNGREALSKSQDRFYNSMKSIVDLTAELVARYDQGQKIGDKPPRNCVIAFPTILIDGPLFEAYYCDGERKTKVTQVKQVRCHWRGSSSWLFISTIDIVTLEHFEEFCRVRLDDARHLLKMMEDRHERVLECFSTKSLDPLKIEEGGRGVIGIPPLLRRAIEPPAPSRKR